jgi:hypothetical protein
MEPRPSAVGPPRPAVLSVVVAIAVANAGAGTAVVVGCGGTPPCRSSLACDELEVCSVRGRCEPRQAIDDGVRTVWAPPTRWAATTSAAREPIRDRDGALLGGAGGGRLWLAFDALPTDAARALLVLGPSEREGRAEDVDVIVERVRDRRSLAAVHVAAGAPRPIRIDLSTALGEPALELAIRVERGTLAVATPLHADSRARPRLELAVPRAAPDPRSAPEVGAATEPAPAAQ